VQAPIILNQEERMKQQIKELQLKLEHYDFLAGYTYDIHQARTRKMRMIQDEF
jgi:hypothetical protein